ncbi:cell cycle progression protein 1 [Oryzias melastigma]|uniref:Cell cycle progression 1 n=1 Tax=Oryzias melastigma TaxID=30732 RepID=A0A3B3B769_ORYME|nr:cell cycle progression protein 1 [Oryzias melastigma]XP_024151436.1 cell cycle progression protein 1 [Oryzias melastigma]
MSEPSSDTESSCGWSIISNEGSDIETLGPEATAEFGAELLEHSTLEEPLQLDSQTLAPALVETAQSLHDTLEEQVVDKTLYCLSTKAPENDVEGEAAGKEPVLSSSDLSDIVTLGDVKEDEHTEEEAPIHEDLYLGTSSSSHYAFTSAAAETVFPVQQPAVTNSSSSEDEAERSSGVLIRRRRVRRNTAGVTDPEDEEQEALVLESRSADEKDERPEEEEQEHEEEQEEAEPTAAANDLGHSWDGSILNKCVLLALIIAISMGFGHFYGTSQIQERQKIMDKTKVNELDGVRDLIQQHAGDQSLSNQIIGSDYDNLDEKQIMLLLTEVIKKLKKENQELIKKQEHIQAKNDELKLLLKQAAEDNHQLKIWLQDGEKSLFVLQEELGNLRSKVRDLEAAAAGADSLLLENQSLKEQLEDERQLAVGIQIHNENMEAEAQILRLKFDKEKRVTEELREEVSQLRSLIPEAGKEAGADVEELQSHLMELEKKLSFEQQRSDLFERLYVETKEERVKGDRESKQKKTKPGMAGKVKETFDAVKNSTKEFVHHHKEQIKKAKEAVKENLRKFSDSVKSTFRHFKDSASTFLNKARGFYKKNNGKNSEDSWEHTSHSYPHNTRKSTWKAHEDQTSSSHQARMKGCTGVFDCAYQESMSLFNKATEPIRADEFHQLLRSYLQQEVDHFHHWKELDAFLGNFFHNGVFIHDQMLFTDFVSEVEDYLTDMQEHYSLDEDVFGDLDDFIYRHFFRESYAKSFSPRGPFERPNEDTKEELRARHQQRKQHKARSRQHRGRKCRRAGRSTDPHLTDVKIELGPMPFDPKY